MRYNNFHALYLYKKGSLLRSLILIRYTDVTFSVYVTALGREMSSHTTEVKTVLRGLDRYTVYSIQVTAYTRVGEGVRSEPVFVQTKQDGEISVITYNNNIIITKVVIFPFILVELQVNLYANSNIEMCLKSTIC